MTTKNNHGKTIAIVAYPGITLLELVGTYSMLVGLTMRGEYRLVVVGPQTGPTSSDTPMCIFPDQTFQQVPNPDMHFVLGGPGAMNELQNQELLGYLKAAAASAELVGAVGTGALLLAAAGLLNDKQATTHWAYRQDLERLGACYMRQAWVQDGKFITSAGVSGGMDMGLHLLDQRIGRSMARTVQTLAEYDPEPPFGGIDWTRAPGQEADYRRLFEQWPAASGERRQVAFVLYPGLTPLDIAGPLQVLSALSYFDPRYEAVVVSERVEPIHADNGLKLLADKSFEDVPHPHALIVPGGGNPTIQALSSQAIRTYIRGAAQTAALVGSVCTGALLLASVGLLRGLPATTHWAYYRVLESLGSHYVRKRWVENEKIITSAGVSAGIDMALYFVSRLTDTETARRVQLAIQYDPQSPLGRIEWERLSPMLRILRAGLSLAAPFHAARPKRLLRQGR